jgi:hypothetical protein
VAEPRDTIRLVAIPRLMVAGVAIFAAWYSHRVHSRPGFGTVIVDRTSFTIDGCKQVPALGPDAIGADLRSSKRNVLRLIRDEHGLQLWLYPQDAGAMIPVDQRDCSQWDVTFFSEGSDWLKPVGGDVTVTCTAGGRKIDSAAFFDHCPS